MAGLWYRAGTISVTNGSKKVTGFETQFKTSTYKPDKGHTFWGPDGKHYEVDYVESDTVLYLVQAYTGATAAGQYYEIDITRTGTTPALSREISAQLAYAQGQYDSWQQILTGAGDVTLTAPDARQITVPALSNMLSKSGNLAGLANIIQARVNLGMTAGAGAAVENDINLPSRLMRWMNYGTGHTIFDASKGVSPNNTPIDNLNPQNRWEASHPTLMGWNGTQTYGVRVESAHVSDGWLADNYAGLVSPAGFLPFDILVNNEQYWVRLVTLPASGSGSRDSVTIRGAYGAWAGHKINFEFTVVNREGFKLSGSASQLGDPVVSAWQNADGTTDVYIYVTNFTTLVGDLRWQIGSAVVPRLDRVDIPTGTLVHDGSAEAGRLNTRLTDKDQISGYWDPVISGIVNYTVKNATYVRLGKTVTVRAYLSFIGASIPSNDGVIRGLPFVPKSHGVGSYTPCAVYRGGVQPPDLNAYIDGGVANITINDPVSRQQKQFESGCDYIFSVTYEIA